MITKFVVNNKVYSAIKILSFVNYGKKLKVEIDIKRKEKMKKVTKFVERMRKF